MNLQDLAKMESGERAGVIAGMNATELAQIKAEIRRAEKPVDPEMMKLEAAKAELVKDPAVAEYLNVMAELKAKRVRNVTADKKYRHDEKYHNIQLEDNTVLVAEGKGWKDQMQKAGYTTGQLQMILKGQRGFKDGVKYPNTLTVKA
jgi:hypothetical protein